MTIALAGSLPRAPACPTSRGDDCAAYGDRTVLTTGASSGIGLATALELAHRGFRSVAGVRSNEKARIVSEAASRAGILVETVLLDVTDGDRCARVIDEIRPYALVNNAGCPAAGAIEDVDDPEARHVLETMVVAPMRLARLALRHMVAAGEGRIVNVSSLYGRITTPLTGWYQAAKHALEALSDALRVEVASTGVKIVVVAPGGFRTGIWEQAERDVVGRRGHARYHEPYLRSVAGMRASQWLMGDPSRVADVIARSIIARRPRKRRLVGYDASLFMIADRLLPAAVKDRLERTILGL